MCHMRNVFHKYDAQRYGTPLNFLHKLAGKSRMLLQLFNTWSVLYGVSPKMIVQNNSLQPISCTKYRSGTVFLSIFQVC